MNIFSVDSVDIALKQYDFVVRLQGVVKARVDIICDEHGNKQQTLKMIAEARGNSDEDALLKSIQMLINHEYIPSRELHIPKCGCCISLDKVTYNFSLLNSPFRELFEDLFTGNNWSIKKALQY